MKCKSHNLVHCRRCSPCHGLEVPDSERGEAVLEERPSKGNEVHLCGPIGWGKQGRREQWRG